MLLNKIKKFNIKNFRRFEALDIEFEDNNNFFILCGKNGIGKTSILEAINICFSEKTSKHTNIKETDFYSDKSIEFYVELKKYFFLEFEDSGYKRLIPCNKFNKIIKRRKRAEQNKSFSSVYDIKTSYLIDNFNYNDKEYKEIKKEYINYLPTRSVLVKGFEKKGDTSFIYRKASGIESDVFEHFGYQYGNFNKLLIPDVFYFPYNRESQVISGYNTIFSNIINELNWRYKKNFSDKGNKKEIIGKAKNLNINIDKLNENYKKKLLDPAILELKKEMEINFEKIDLHCFNYLEPYNSSILGVESSKNNIIPASNLGSGFASIIGFLLSVSFAKQTKNPLIMLVDEPELHLESILQKKLRDYFKKSEEFQTIISTHSHLFINNDEYKNNIILENKNNNNIKLTYCDEINVSDLIFRLLGNSLDDLYIPKKIVLVEGKHDKNIILKCLDFLDYEFENIQLIPAGSKDNIPDKSESYQEVIDNILKKGKWYSDSIIKILKIIVDNDVSDGKINSWVVDYGFNKDEQIKKIDSNGIEFLFPESLIKKCIEKTELSDKSFLKNKEKNKIIKIIFKDDKKESNAENYSQVKNRISKARLNEYIINNINKKIFDNEESKKLKELVEFLCPEI